MGFKEMWSDPVKRERAIENMKLHHRSKRGYNSPMQGVHLNEETKRKIGAKVKAAWSEGRVNKDALIKKRLANPNFHKNRSESSKKAWMKYRDKYLGLTGAKTDKSREKLGRSQKKNWLENPQRWLLPMRTKKHRELIAQIARDTWADPIVRKKRLESIRKWRNNSVEQEKHRAIFQNSEYKEGQSKKSMETWKDPCVRERRIKGMKATVDVMREKLKRLWRENPDHRKRVLSFSGENPNKMEKELQQILSALFPNEYKYVGKGDFHICGKVPDFICFQTKKIIELFGAYWHQNEEENSKRIKTFAKEGYEALVIWDEELKNMNRENLIKKLLNFHAIGQSEYIC